MQDHAKMKCKFLRPSELREKVEEFRNTCWKSKTIPVDIEHIIEQELHLEIIPIHDIRQLDRVDAYLKSDLSGIVVDIVQYMDPQNRYANRLRFSFAHEVGHFILHKDVYKHFDIDTPEEYYDFLIHFPDDQYRSFEWQANEFAGSLLVPRARLVAEIDRCKAILSEKGLAYLWEENRDQALASMSPALTRVFGVSDDVIEARIRVERDLWA
jgi:hypothetical protein